MDHNILLSKIVANPTENTWSQAYSTLNLYIALSIKSEPESESIASKGKEILEKLQREFFAVDEKNLKNVKEAVENTVKEIGSDIEYSIILASINNNTLYIIIGSEGKAVLKRGSQVGLIANGQKGEISGFSGKLLNNDIVILETEDFSKKISLEKLSSMLDHLEVVEIAENLAPVIHEGSNGSEAAIVIQYKKESFEAMPDEITIDRPQEITRPSAGFHFSLPNFIKNFSLPKIQKISIYKIPKTGNKKFLILGGIIILVLFLAGSMYFESKKQEKIKEEKVLAEILTPANKQYNEAVELINLNKNLAAEEFDSLKQSLDEKRKGFPEKSDSLKKIDELIGNVEKKIGELSDGTLQGNQKLVLSANEKDLNKMDIVEKKENTFYVISSNDGIIGILTNDAKVDKTFKTEVKNILYTTADENNIYVLGDSGVSKIDKKSGKATTIISAVSNLNSATGGIDTFSGNIYALNKKDKTIDKFQPSTFSKTSYFTESVSFANLPLSFGIDSSIWIIDNAGKIRKFTKGKEENFAIKGLIKTIGKESILKTSTDFSNLYILDKDNKRIISLSKSGDFNNQYVWKNLEDASSFTVDEPSKKAYVAIGGNLYSIDL